MVDGKPVEQDAMVEKAVSLQNVEVADPFPGIQWFPVVKISFNGKEKSEEVYIHGSFFDGVGSFLGGVGRRVVAPVTYRVYAFCLDIRFIDLSAR